MRPRLVTVAVIVLLVAAFATGLHFRGALGDEISTVGIHAWVGGLGWKGVALFLALVVFRQFMLLPAALVLPVGGLCFGAAAGTALGALGIVLSAAMKFALARTLGRAWIAERPRGRTLAARIERIGPVAIGISTAHPMGPLSPLHWGAGLTAIPAGAFLAAVTLGAPVRAFAYSFFGAALDEGGGGVVTGAVVLLAVALLPLLHPAIRRRIRAAWR
jgi:uncharacterized membrane protein YdjX (TVP38/TMEM64 family)